MTISQAKKILGISAGDDIRTVKLKYHRLIARYHPDALGDTSPELLSHAQLINEAYHLLQTTPDAFARTGHAKDMTSAETTASSHSLWHQDLTPELFAERDIFITHEIYGESYVSHAATGRYLWDPEAEDFSLFLKSINLLCTRLLDQSETEGSASQMDGMFSEEARLRRHRRLFHALSEHYMDPHDCLRKLADPVKTDSEGRLIFRFRAHLAATRFDDHWQTLCSLTSGQLVWPHKLQDNRILVRTEDGRTLGHLSLEKDAYYLCLIPLLRKKQAQVRMQILEIFLPNSRGVSGTRASVDLSVRMNREPSSRDRAAEVQQIRQLLF
ncbi:MAG: J domain-containing protein [Eubacteriales bacterium]|nr:J domain-containing protein [Eubacteriales bacterium]